MLRKKNSAGRYSSSGTAHKKVRPIQVLQLRAALFSISYLVFAASTCENRDDTPPAALQAPASPPRASESKVKTKPAEEASPKKVKVDEKKEEAALQTKTEESSQDSGSDTPVHVWQKGDELETVVRRRYDIPKNRDWTDSLRVEAIVDLVLGHNGLKSQKQIPEGKEIVLPPREEMFIEAGFPSELGAQLTSLFRAESLYYEHCENALDFMCNKGKAIPREMKDDFAFMAQTVTELKTDLEARKTNPPSKQLRKALGSLTSLRQGFTFTINYKTYDEEHCDFAAKDITATKRVFSNLSYQLYKWSGEKAH
jgi:hypothetical protein